MDIMGQSAFSFIRKSISSNIPGTVKVSGATIMPSYFERSGIFFTLTSPIV